MPSRPLLGLCVLVFIISLASCEALRRFATARALVDRPKPRSLHSIPMPLLGGVGVAASMLLGGLVLTLAGGRELVPLLVAGALVAILGLVDDLRPLGIATRLCVQVLVATWFVHVEAPHDVRLLPDVSPALPPIVGEAALVLWIVAVLNIYNFMDGMDGLASLQGVSASLGQIIVLAGAGASDLAGLAAILGASTGGFLVHNFPPSRMFLGDSGSTFLGFIFAALATMGMRHGVSLAEMALPLAPFLLEGTFTVIARAARSEPIWLPHRSHLFQRAILAGLEHRDVLMVYACWMGCALAFVCGSWPFSVTIGWAMATCGLLLVRGWVVRAEPSFQRNAVGR